MDIGLKNFRMCCIIISLLQLRAGDWGLYLHYTSEIVIVPNSYHGNKNKCTLFYVVHKVQHPKSFVQAYSSIPPFIISMSASMENSEKLRSHLTRRWSMSQWPSDAAVSSS